MRGLVRWTSTIFGNRESDRVALDLATQGRKDHRLRWGALGNSSLDEISAALSVKVDVFTQAR